MFNFSIFTKALTDNTLSKNEFRVLCLMLNTSSFKQSNTIEMFNGFIQDTLGISERNVRDITKSLELKNYVKKEVNTNSHNRNANTYTILGAESCAEKCAENCPPNNIDIKHNNKNISKDFSTYGNSTCREKDITKWTKVFDENNNLKENEMSDNGTNAMNAISEQSERQAKENESSGCGKENEMATSTSGDKNNTSKGEHNVPVVNPKDKIIPRPAPAPQTQNKATGEPQNVSVDNLSTQGKKTQPEPQECPQNETNVFNRISEILEEALTITDVEPFKEKLQEALDMLKQIRPSANRNAFTRCCDDTIYWFKNNNWDDLDMFFVASDFKKDIERMKRA